MFEYWDLLHSIHVTQTFKVLLVCIMGFVTFNPCDPNVKSSAGLYNGICYIQSMWPKC